MAGHHHLLGVGRGPEPHVASMPSTPKARSRRQRPGALRSVVAAAAVMTACTSHTGGDPPTQPVTGGEVRLAVAPGFRALLGESGLHLVSTPPPCSWRLSAPACGGAPATDPDSVVLPVVGGNLSVWSSGARLRGRIELAGRAELVGARGAVRLEDLTIAPASSTISAGISSGRADVLFLDGSAATFTRRGGGVDVGGVEVKLLRALAERVGATLGGAALPELVKVGDLAMRVAIGSRSGGT